MNTICGIGHRPKKLPTGYDLEPLIDIARVWLSANRPDVVISGMALGWDQALAIAALDLGIEVHAYIPFIGQADQWPKASCEDYSMLLARCAVKKVICPGKYSPEKMQRRNEAMVDDCDLVLALWDGTKGGTGNCLAYADFMDREVVNLWPQYTELLAFL